MSYKEVEVKVMGGRQNGSTFMLNASNINYYRAMIDADGIKGKVNTMLYFNGSDKAVRLECTPDYLSRKLKNSIDCSHLTTENFNKVIDFVKNLS